MTVFPPKTPVFLVFDTEKIAKNVLDATIVNTAVKSRGIKPGKRYAILRRTNMLAILIEPAFMDSSDNQRYLQDEDYYKRAARGIYQGILKSIQENLI